ncbi:universal stress protein [Georgenia wangjunii]|uniref:universal stress protein n=1 Tax=Georgenia wangjunii TaxID=3117730 RepID=UPI002F266E79
MRNAARPKTDRAAAPSPGWVMDGIVTELEVAGGVVVGDDGSACAEVAVRYAFEEAARRGAPVHVVRSWTIPTGVRPDDVPFGTTPSIVELQDGTLAETERRIADLRAELPGVEAHAHAVHGRADHVLVGAARGADVLVVGSRGRGRVASALLGSVATACMRHSTVPVVVVR